jgi:hypothetical protein
MATFNNNFDKSQINQLNQAGTINNPQANNSSENNVGGNQQNDIVGNVGGDYLKNGNKNTNSKNINFKLVVSITITVSVAITLYVLFGTELGQNFLDQIFNS